MAAVLAGISFSALFIQVLRVAKKSFSAQVLCDYITFFLNKKKSAMVPFPCDFRRTGNKRSECITASMNCDEKHLLLGDIGPHFKYEASESCCFLFESDLMFRKYNL
jgi:hypothetical protein